MALAKVKIEGLGPYATIPQETTDGFAVGTTDSIYERA